MHVPDPRTSKKNLRPPSVTACRGPAHALSRCPEPMALDLRAVGSIVPSRRLALSEPSAQGVLSVPAQATVMSVSMMRGVFSGRPQPAYCVAMRRR